MENELRKQELYFTITQPRSIGESRRVCEVRKKESLKMFTNLNMINVTVIKSLFLCAVV